MLSKGQRANQVTRGKSRRSFCLLSLAALMLTFMLGLILWQVLTTQSILSVQQTLDTWRPCLTALRCLLIAAVFLGWPWISRYLIVHKKRSEPRVKQLSGYRWRLLRWLIILELILGQNLVGQFIAQLPATINRTVNATMEIADGR